MSEHLFYGQTLLCKLAWTLLDCVCVSACMCFPCVRTHNHQSSAPSVSSKAACPPRGWSGEILHFFLKKENSLNVQRQRWNANETAENAIFTYTFPLDIVSYLWVTSALCLRCLYWREDTPDQLMPLKKQTRNNSESWPSQAGCFHSCKETRPKLWSAGMKIIRWDCVTGQGAGEGV